MGSGDGGDPGLLVVYNPHAWPVNATISLQVPVCALGVVDAVTQAAVEAQVPPASCAMACLPCAWI